MGIALWSGLWFGLAIPVILLMYLFKRKYIDTTVSSHLLWNHVLRNIEANRPWQKLQNRLLLWLQLLVAALLVFALMAPYLWVQGGSKHTVVIVDASASMSTLLDEQAEQGADRAGDTATGNGKLGREAGSSGTQLGNETVRQEAEKSVTISLGGKDVRQIGTISRMEWLKGELSEFTASLSKKSELTLLKLGSKPEVLLSHENDRGKWKQAISSLAVDYGASAYRETLSLAAAMTKDDPEAQVVIFTDGRWMERSDDILFDVPVSIMTIGDTKIGNATIEQFGVRNKEASGTVDGVAIVRNDGSDELEAELHLYGDDRLLASRQVVISARQAVTESFAELPAAEVYRLTLSPGDSYLLDNEAFAFREQHAAPNVLLVSRGNLFLEKALQLAGASVIRMTPADKDGNGEVEEPTLPEQTPEIIVADGSMPDYMQHGAWAELVSRTPLWTIGGAGDKLQLSSGELKIEDHPLTRYFTLKDSPTGFLYQAQVPEWAKTIMKIDRLPAIYAGSEAGTARLGFLFALEDSDLPLRSEFPILVHNAVEWLQSGRATGLGRAMVEAKVAIPVNPDAKQGRWTPVSGYALSSKAADIPAEAKGGSILVEQTAPAIPGLWRFVQRDVDGNELASYYLQTTASPLESSTQAVWPLQPAAAAQGGEQMEQSGNEVTDGTGNSPAVQDSESGQTARAGEGRGDFSSRYSLAYLIALLAFIVIFAEWGVYQRGRSI
ncbi:VWA domain-containing protein [Paenibacillus sp. D2_2]|uniref:vWA domain-containing protein n=1 Tax=Paenibacillus sp. D2_2 TaxID=3073092 RepID=UPI002815926C|nr:VWA domain-containing protein [Paenibacillus sp. D2_2]WMT39922.1 VWA domain-containing protein [Paenibacillus sp. D2_2]